VQSVRPLLWIKCNALNRLVAGFALDFAELGIGNVKLNAEAELSSLATSLPLCRHHSLGNCLPPWGRHLAIFLLHFHYHV